MTEQQEFTPEVVAIMETSDIRNTYYDDADVEAIGDLFLSDWLNQSFDLFAISQKADKKTYAKFHRWAKEQKTERAKRIKKLIPRHKALLQMRQNASKGIKNKASKRRMEYYPGEYSDMENDTFYEILTKSTYFMVTKIYSNQKNEPGVRYVINFTCEEEAYNRRSQDTGLKTRFHYQPAYVGHAADMQMCEGHAGFYLLDEEPIIKSVLFASNIPRGDEVTVYDVYRAFPSVASVCIPRDIDGIPLGYAFLIFMTHDETVEASKKEFVEILGQNVQLFILEFPEDEFDLDELKDTLVDQKEKLAFERNQRKKKAQQKKDFKVNQRTNKTITSAINQIGRNMMNMVAGQAMRASQEMIARNFFQMGWQGPQNQQPPFQQQPFHQPFRPPFQQQNRPKPIICFHCGANHKSKNCQVFRRDKSMEEGPSKVKKNKGIAFSAWSAPDTLSDDPFTAPVVPEDADDADEEETKDAEQEATDHKVTEKRATGGAKKQKKQPRQIHTGGHMNQMWANNSNEGGYGQQGANYNPFNSPQNQYGGYQNPFGGVQPGFGGGQNFGFGGGQNFGFGGGQNFGFGGSQNFGFGGGQNFGFGGGAQNFGFGGGQNFGFGGGQNFRGGFNKKRRGGGNNF